jgi:hypothetical protein
MLLNFSDASFTEGAKFYGLESFTPTKTAVDFSSTHIERPELISFHTVRLRPSWFIDVDARKFNFTAVRWYKPTLEAEIRTIQENVPERDKEQSYTLLAQACQRLAANVEENRNYADASDFNYWAMDAQRREKRASAFAPWRLIWWYWALSGYGERTGRSGLWLIGIWFGFAVLYMLVGYVQGLPSTLSHVQGVPDAVAYSPGVLSRQADKLPTDASTLLRFLVFIEGILGPLQVALFALALRRKFMRGKG